MFVVAGFKLARSPTAREDGRHGCHLEVSEEAGSSIYVRGYPTFFALFFLPQIPTLKFRLQ